MLPTRLRRLLAGMCAEDAVEVITTAISYTLGCACLLVESKQASVIVTLSKDGKLSEQAAELVLRRLLMAMATKTGPKAQDLPDLVAELVEVARAS